MRTALAALVVVATLPYLFLKALWLTGHPLGVLDPAFLASPGLHTANLATAGMDLVAVLLAVVLATGVRPPAWTVLLPGWVGSGFLVPIVLTTAPGLLLGGPAGPEPLADWVKPLVYGGFTLQGVGLVGLLGLHALRRWPDAVRPGPAVGWARTVVYSRRPRWSSSRGWSSPGPSGRPRDSRRARRGRRHRRSSGR